MYEARYDRYAPVTLADFKYPLRDESDEKKAEIRAVIEAEHAKCLAAARAREAAAAEAAAAAPAGEGEAGDADASAPPEFFFAAPKQRRADGSYAIAPAFVDIATPLEQLREPVVAGPLMIQKDARRTNRTDHTKFM